MAADLYPILGTAAGLGSNGGAPPFSEFIEDNLAANIRSWWRADGEKVILGGSTEVGEKRAGEIWKSVNRVSPGVPLFIADLGDGFGPAFDFNGTTDGFVSFRDFADVSGALITFEDRHVEFMVVRLTAPVDFSNSPFFAEHGPNHVTNVGSGFFSTATGQIQIGVRRTTGGSLESRKRTTDPHAPLVAGDWMLLEHMYHIVTGPTVTTHTIRDKGVLIPTTVLQAGNPDGNATALSHHCSRTESAFFLKGQVREYLSLSPSPAPESAALISAREEIATRWGITLP